MASNIAQSPFSGAMTAVWKKDTADGKEAEAIQNRQGATLVSLIMLNGTSACGGLRT